MVKTLKTVLLAAGIGIGAPAYSVHYKGHFEPQQPSAAEIAKFCADYEKDPEAMANYIGKYRQYCPKPGSKPSAPKPAKPPKKIVKPGKISRIVLPPCLNPQAVIKVEGRGFKQHKLRCQFKPALGLKKGSGNDKQAAFSVMANAQPDQNYRLRCQIDQHKKTSPSVKACVQAPPAVRPQIRTRGRGSKQSTTVDLVTTLKFGGPVKQKPGEAQEVKVTFKNKSTYTTGKKAKGPITGLLVLATRDLSKAGTKIQPKPKKSIWGPSIEKIPGALAQVEINIPVIPIAGQSIVFAVELTLPDDMGTRPYYWCSVVDIKQQVSETNEHNNVSCLKKQSAGAFGRMVENVTLLPQGQGRIGGITMTPRKQLNLRQAPGLTSRTLPIIRDPGRAPLPPSASCSPTVYMWFDPSSYRNVYFKDQAFTVRYSVDCATDVSVGDTEFFSTAEALAARRGGFFTDSGRGSGPGATSGNRTYPAGALAAGNYAWWISASNRLNPSAGSSSETARWAMIANPRIDASCDVYRSCIASMVRHIAPLIDAGIINNSALDREVEAFSAGIYDRQTIGLQLKRQLETMDVETNIRCTICDGDSSFSDRTPENVWLYMCESPRSYATDFALLHELTHKNGFASSLIRLFEDRGVWPRVGRSTPEYSEYRNRVEQMTAAVAGAPFDRSRTCFDYGE